MTVTDLAIRPFRDGLYRDGALIAGVSRASGRVYFPKPAVCFDSLTDTIDELVLGEACTLFSFTTVHMKTLHFDPPYSIGYADFPEGVRVFGPIKTEDASKLKVGMNLRVELTPLWTDDTGAPVLAHRFVPA